VRLERQEGCCDEDPADDPKRAEYIRNALAKAARQTVFVSHVAARVVAIRRHTA